MIAAARATLLSVVPTMLAALLERDGEPLLRTAGCRVPTHVMQRARDGIDAVEVDWTNLYADPMTPTSSPSLTLDLDKTHGVNGEKANLSITVNRAEPTGVTLVLLRSTLGDETHVMPLLVGQNATAPAAAKAASPRGVQSGVHRRRNRQTRSQ